MDLHTFLEEHNGKPLTIEEQIQYYELLINEYKKNGDQESANQYYFIKSMLEKSGDVEERLQL